jgi:uncharacterized protein YaaQ
MKLIIAIVPDNDNDPVSHALTSSDFRVTYVASTGGFLRRGHSTLLIGVEDDKLERALEIIRKNCAPMTDPNAKRGVIFVLKVDQFIHF